MSRLLPALALFVATVGVLTGSARAGDVDPVFAARLAALPPGARLPALVMMREQLDVASLSARLESGNATRWKRHTVVCTAAQEVALRTQAPVLARIARLAAAGQVNDVQPFWILNAIALRGTPAALAEISLNPAVKIVEDADARIELIHPVGPPVPALVPLASAPEPGLLGIRADFLWNLGYLGEGRIVSNLDTGVDGNHVAFASRWRGKVPGVPVSAAWHSPSRRAPTPTGSGSHGTHTMGTLCGDEGLNRIGVCPKALWIASDVVAGNIGQLKTDAIAAFQWSADPDANVFTVNDVPDSSCNSWRLIPSVPSHGTIACDNLFWLAIDMADAAGCAVVFAAGNEGTVNGGVANLGTPSDRSTSETSTFSVGALQANQITIATFSSRGPSGCAGAAIKPEVCAQGQNVRSSILGGSYDFMSGTSMACPHVAGAVALLRQVDPNMSSQKVKEVLYQTVDDLGPAGNDNTYGFGRINLEKAYNMVIAGIDRVTVGVVCPKYQVKQGTNLVFELGLTSYSQTPVTTLISVDLFVPQLNVFVKLVTPTTVTVPAGFSVDPDWIASGLAIPAGLDPILFTYSYQVVVRAVDPATQQTMSVAMTDFRIVP